MDVRLGKVQQEYPWPNECPQRRTVAWSLDAGGRRLITRLIRDRSVRLVVEIGAFLGGSVKTWLEASPQLVVVAIDPWPGGAWLGKFAREHAQPDWVVDQLVAGDDAHYETFLANLWEKRDRVVPVRGLALEVLPRLAELGLCPDLIYLDADKTGGELECCRALFPAALLSGDDWFMGRDQFWRADEGYPIRKSVREYCRQHGGFLKVDRHTWLIDRERPTWSDWTMASSYHFKSVRRRLRGLWRVVRRLGD